MAKLVNAMIADSSANMRRMTMSCLRDSGLADFEFTEAADGDEALRKFFPGVTDILFVDMLMPGMGGVELISAIRKKHGTRPPSVMITSEQSKERLMAVVNEAVLDALIFKPVNTARIKQDLAKLINNLPDQSGPWRIPHGDCVALATQEMLARLCNLDSQPEPTEELVGTGNVVFATLPVVGDFRWTVVLGFEQDTAEAVVGRFVGEKIAFDHPDMGDAVGEVTNNVAGHIKRLLAARNVDVELQTPTVLCAHGLQFLVQPAGKTRLDQVCFKSPLGRLWVGVTVGANAGLVL